MINSKFQPETACRDIKPPSTGLKVEIMHGIIVHSIPAREIYTRKNRKVSPPPPQKHTKITHMNTKHSEHHKTQHGSRTLGAQP